MTDVAAPIRTPRTPAAGHQGRRCGRVPATVGRPHGIDGTSTDIRP